MAVREILVFPDPRLKAVCKEVKSLDEGAGACVQDLVDTMNSHDYCVGMGAPQIGELLRIIAVDCSRYRKPVPNRGLIVLLNPQILTAEGKEIAREGCLSLPDYTGNVERAVRVVIQGLDRTGRLTLVETEGFEARALQHEIDHLDGILFLDRIASLKTDLFRRKARA
jgi:peptide deformylase